MVAVPTRRAELSSYSCASPSALGGVVWKLGLCVHGSSSGSRGWLCVRTMQIFACCNHLLVSFSCTANVALCYSASGESSSTSFQHKGMEASPK